MLERILIMKNTAKAIRLALLMVVVNFSVSVSYAANYRIF